MEEERQKESAIAVEVQHGDDDAHASGEFGQEGLAPVMERNKPPSKKPWSFLKKEGRVSESD